MCSSAVAGTGDGLLISRQCWMGTKHRLCPGRSRDLLVVPGPLNSALLCHHITGLMWWPGIHCQTPVPALESQVPESPWEGRGHTSWVCGWSSTPTGPLVWLPCLHCWQLLPVLLLTNTLGWGAGGWLSPAWSRDAALVKELPPCSLQGRGPTVWWPHPGGPIFLLKKSLVL